MQTTMERSKKGEDVGRPPKETDESTYQGRFAARLKLLRTKSGIEVERLAELVTSHGHKVSPQTIYHWESGRYSPPLNAFPALAKALKLKAIAALLPKR